MCASSSWDRKLKIESEVILNVTRLKEKLVVSAHFKAVCLLPFFFNLMFSSLNITGDLK